MDGRSAQIVLVRQLLAQTDERSATAAIYVYVDGMSHKEAAEVMDVSRQTVGSLLERFDVEAAALMAKGGGQAHV